MKGFVTGDEVLAAMPKGYDKHLLFDLSASGKGTGYLCLALGKRDMRAPLGTRDARLVFPDRVVADPQTICFIIGIEPHERSAAEAAEFERSLADMDRIARQTPFRSVI